MAAFGLAWLGFGGADTVDELVEWAGEACPLSCGVGVPALDIVGGARLPETRGMVVDERRVGVAEVSSA